MRKKIHNLSFLIFCFGIFLISNNFAFSLEIPAFNSYVTDNANIINSDDLAQIEQYLTNLKNKTGVQLAVLTIPSLQDEDLETYSYKVAESWALGQKDKDNGILLLVALAERKIRIEVGYGLEDKLTDAKCGLIIRNIIAPEFRNENYSQGILNAIKNISGIVTEDSELIDKDALENTDSSTWQSILFGFSFVFGWFILFSCLASGKQNHWLPWIIFTKAYRNQMNASNVHRTYSNSSSNFRSNFTNHRDGGFSGGGGGGFGGGGASGGW